MEKNANLTIENTVHKYLMNRASYYETGEGPSRQLNNLQSGLKPLIESIGHLPITELDGPRLAELRDEWAKTTNLVRTTINKRMQYVVAFGRWCVEKGIIKAEQLVSLQAVEKVKRGRYGVRDAEPVGPADPGHVAAVMRDLPSTARGIIEMMQLTGMRPGEVRTMRACDLELIRVEHRTVYRFTPKRHKTAHLGKRRRIFLVGRAYSLANERLSTLIGSSLFEAESQGYLFSVDDDGNSPYQINSLHQAVRRSCDRLSLPRWTPNQLRHSYATNSRSKGFKLELIADLLGHADPRTTLIYAEPDDEAALRAAIQLAG